ncbi:hypothetical protein F5Y10DRAFT_239544 [Nemania abortiva]|nr:hypothetical protein F5Y10DRAFT_239544 [Nemania abortiva]
MADPMGVLGTAVGVVSLGLQIYRSLNACVADFIAREEQVTTALTALADFERTIVDLNTAVQIFQDNNLIPLDADLSLLRSCEAQMEGLRRPLQDYKLSLTMGTLSRLRKKLGYPLNRGKLNELEKSLHDVTSNLSIAVGTLCLFSSASIGRSVQAVDTTQQTQTGLITNLDKKLDEIKTSYQDIAAQLNSFHVGSGGLIHALQSRMTQLSIQSEAQMMEIRKMSLELKQIGDISGANGDRLSTSEFESRTVVSTGLTAKRDSSDYVQSAPPDAKRSLLTPIVSQNAVISMSGPSPDEPRMSQALTKADRRSSLNRLCTCSVRTRRRTTRTTAHWKYFSLYSLYSSENTSPTHEPECGLYLADLATKCWTLGLSFTGLR